MSENGTVTERPTWDLEGKAVVLGDYVVVRPDDELDPEVVSRDGNVEQLQGGLYVVRDPNGHDPPEPTLTGIVVGVGPGEMIVNPLLQSWAPGALDAEGRAVPFPAPFVYKPMSVTIGQRVAHSKYGIAEVEIAGEVFRTMRDADCRAVLLKAAAEPSG